jgi:hypothetical protein
MLWSPSGNVLCDTLGGHVVELLSLEPHGRDWYVLAAVDGQKLSQAFIEPYDNIAGLGEDALIAHLKEQALSFAEYEHELGRIRLKDSA